MSIANIIFKISQLITISCVSMLLTGCGLFKNTSYEIKNSKTYNSAGPIVIFGDSLAFGHGSTSEDKSLTGCFRTAFQRPVHNMGRNGATSSDMMSQIEKVKQLKPSMVLVSLGGNDVLRRTSADTTLTNMRQIFKSFIDQDSLVLYLGLKPPQSFFMGRVLDVKRFSLIQDIAKEEGVLLIPDAFEGLWKNPTYMFDDIHPNDKGYETICYRLIALLEPHII